MKGDVKLGRHSTLRLGAGLREREDAEREAEQDEQEHEERQRERIRRRREVLKLPQVVQFSKGGAWPASGNLLLVPEPYGPIPDFQWSVLGIQVVPAPGALTTTYATVRADIYIGPIPGLVTGADQAAFWETFVQGLPADGSFQMHEKVVRSGQGIYAVISGGAAAQSYVFKGRAIQEPIPTEGEAQWQL